MMRVFAVVFMVCWSVVASAAAPRSSFDGQVCGLDDCATVTAGKLDVNATVNVGSVTATTVPPYMDPTGAITAAYIDSSRKVHAITDSGSVVNATLQAGSAVIGKVQIDPAVSSTVNAVTGGLTDTQLRATPVPVSGTVTASGPLTDTQLRATPVPVSGSFTANVSTTPSYDASGAATTASLLSVGGRKAVDVVMRNPTTGAAVDPDATVTVASIADFDGTFSTATSGLSTATTLTQLVALSGTNRIIIKNAKCSASVASTVTADQRCAFYYGTGSNCGTGTTALDGCFQPANGGCNTGELVVPAGNALCWIHAVAGSKQVTATYRYTP